MAYDEHMDLHTPRPVEDRPRSMRPPGTWNDSAFVTAPYDELRSSAATAIPTVESGRNRKLRFRPYSAPELQSCMPEGHREGGQRHILGEENSEEGPGLKRHVDRAVPIPSCSGGGDGVVTGVSSGAAATCAATDAAGAHLLPPAAPGSERPRQCSCLCSSALPSCFCCSDGKKCGRGVTCIKCGITTAATYLPPACHRYINATAEGTEAIQRGNRCRVGRIQQLGTEPHSPPASTATGTTPTPTTTTTTTASPSDVVGSEKGAVSQEAVEAWAAAETWALTMAAATASAAAGKTVAKPEADAAGGNTGDVHVAAQLAQSKECFTMCSNDEGRSGGEGDHHQCEPSSMIGGTCENAIQEHINGVARCTSTKRAVEVGIGMCPVAAGTSPRRCLSDRAPFNRGFKTTWQGTGMQCPRAPFAAVGDSASLEARLGRQALLGGAAAIVLQRIEHGEQVWRRQARQRGVTMLRTHCVRRRQWREKEAAVVKYCERVCLARSFGRMQARILRTGRDDMVAAAAAVAGMVAKINCFRRARRLRRGMAMVKRNWQISAALRSRDDLADLHYAERRIPDVVESWARQAGSQRTVRNAMHAAKNKWKSRSLLRALARWVAVSLGDREGRRRRQKWRHSLLVAQSHADNRDGIDKKEGMCSHVAMRHLRDRKNNSKELDGNSVEAAARSPRPLSPRPLPPPPRLKQPPPVGEEDGSWTATLGQKALGSGQGLTPNADEGENKETPSMETGKGLKSSETPDSAAGWVTGTESTLVHIEQPVEAEETGGVILNQGADGDRQAAVGEVDVCIEPRERGRLVNNVTIAPLELSLHLVTTQRSAMTDRSAVEIRRPEDRNLVVEREQQADALHAYEYAADGNNTAPQLTERHMTLMSRTQVENTTEEITKTSGENTTEIIHVERNKKDSGLAVKVDKVQHPPESKGRCWDPLIGSARRRCTGDAQRGEDGIQEMPVAEVVTAVAVASSPRAATQEEVEGSPRTLAESDSRQNVCKVKMSTGVQQTTGSRSFTVKSEEVFHEARQLRQDVAVAENSNGEEEKEEANSDPTIDWKRALHRLACTMTRTKDYCSADQYKTQAMKEPDAGAEKPITRSWGRDAPTAEPHAHERRTCTSVGQDSRAAEVPDDPESPLVCSGKIARNRRDAACTSVAVVSGISGGAASHGPNTADRCPHDMKLHKLSPSIEDKHHSPPVRGEGSLFPAHRCKGWSAAKTQYEQADERLTSPRQTYNAELCLESGTLQQAVGEISSTTQDRSSQHRVLCNSPSGVREQGEDLGGAVEKMVSSENCVRQKAATSRRRDHTGPDSIMRRYQNSREANNRSNPRSSRSNLGVPELQQSRCPLGSSPSSSRSDLAPAVPVSVKLTPADTGQGHQQRRRHSRPTDDLVSESVASGEPRLEEPTGLAISTHVPPSVSILAPELSSLSWSEPDGEDTTICTRSSLAGRSSFSRGNGAHRENDDVAVINPRQSRRQWHEGVVGTEAIASVASLTVAMAKEGDDERNVDSVSVGCQGSAWRSLSSVCGSAGGGFDGGACDPSINGSRTAHRRMPPRIDEIVTSCDKRTTNDHTSTRGLGQSDSDFPSGFAVQVATALASDRATARSSTDRGVASSRRRNSASKASARVSSRGSAENTVGEETSASVSVATTVSGDLDPRDQRLRAGGETPATADESQFGENVGTTGNVTSAAAVGDMKSGSNRTTGDWIHRSGWEGNRMPFKRSAGASLPAYTATSSSNNSRGRATLQERVSDAFLRRTFARTGLRQWRLRIVGNAFHSRYHQDTNAEVLAFTKRIALAKWRAAHANRLAQKVGAATRQSLRRRLALSQRLCQSTVAATAAAAGAASAIVAIRRWCRRAAEAALLSRTLHAWATQAREVRSVTSHCRRALAHRGVSTWRLNIREARRVSKRAAAVDRLVLTGNARRGFRAWRERRRRRDHVMRTADEYRAYAEGMATPVARVAVRLRRKLRHMQPSLRAWLATAKERTSARKSSRLLADSARDHLRKRVIRGWRARTADGRVRLNRVLIAAEVHQARRSATGVLRGLEHAARLGRTYRDALAAGDEHWKRRGAVWIAVHVRDFVKSQRRVLRRAEIQHFRIAARTGLCRWRQGVRNVQMIRRACGTAKCWLRERMCGAAVAALEKTAHLGTTSNRLMQAGREHVSRRGISHAVASWRGWILRQEASAELSAAAGDFNAARMMSTGLRGLAWAARLRTTQRRAKHVAVTHLFHTAGFERWRNVTAARRQDSAKRKTATVHWATTLLAKVLLSWEAAAVRKWATSRQEEVAAAYNHRLRQKRALKAWTAFVVESSA